MMHASKNVLMSWSNLAEEYKTQIRSRGLCPASACTLLHALPKPHSLLQHSQPVTDGGAFQYEERLNWAMNLQDFI